MPWTKKNYPDSMKNLPPDVRNKAVEIANALLEERNMNEGIVIATAISRAKDWAANRGKSVDPAGESRVTDEKRHGKDQYVLPDDEGWKVKEEKKERGKTYPTKAEAERHATKNARAAGSSVTVKNKDGRIEKRTSYNPNNSGRQK
jgi:uncharacterized protein YdaT